MGGGGKRVTRRCLVLTAAFGAVREWADVWVRVASRKSAFRNSDGKAAALPRLVMGWLPACP